MSHGRCTVKVPDLPPTTPIWGCGKKPPAGSRSALHYPYNMHVWQLDVQKLGGGICGDFIVPYTIKNSLPTIFRLQLLFIGGTDQQSDSFLSSRGLPFFYVVSFPNHRSRIKHVIHHNEGSALWHRIKKTCDSVPYTLPLPL